MEDQARTLCMVGTLDEAIDLCHEALDVFRSIPAPFGIADALTDLGLCYMRRGELERATEALEEAGRMMVESGATGYNATQVRCYLADNARCSSWSEADPRSDGWRRRTPRRRAALRSGTARPSPSVFHSRLVAAARSIGCVGTGVRRVVGGSEASMRASGSGSRIKSP